MSSTTNNPLAAPCKVTGVSVTGNVRVQRSVIEREFKAAAAAKTHHDLAVELSKATARLHGLDSFRGAVCDVDAGEGPDEVTVAVNVAEKGRHTLATTPQVVGEEGLLNVSWVYRNFLGQAERVKGSLSVGHRGSNALVLEALKPYIVGSTGARASIFHKSDDHMLTSSYREARDGISISTSSLSSPVCITYELARRRLTGLEAGAGPLETWKSSISHVCTTDTRDDVMTPSNGMLCRSKFELAGLGIGEQFWRHSVDYQSHRSLGDGKADTRMSLFGSINMVQALGHTGWKGLGPNDKTFVGGAGGASRPSCLPMRGFMARGVGPRGGDATATNAALGGDVGFTLGGMISAAVPGAPEWLAARIQAFGTLGNSVASPQGSSVLKSLPKAVAGCRCAVGAGITVPTPVGRLEVNLCMPLRVSAKDGDRPVGLQAGIWEE